ncbi:MAG: hypothetical protein GTN40_05475 [Candidatus Aenigmarchaeota archaeon]|nr:hypothetical protein [Candidatus Aenigmarchaeota archaeon]
MKGQTAVEYLMTYGWAILIILIVAGVLAYYGIFAPGSFVGPSKKGFATVDIISPWDLDSSDVLRLTFENRVGEAINITSVSADEGTTAPTTPTACGGLPAGGIQIAAGARSTVTSFTCGGANAGSTGQPYQLYVIVTYDAGAMTDLKSTGTLSGSVS